MPELAEKSVRRHRPRQDPGVPRRAETFGGTIGLTALGAMLPGVGYLMAGRRRLGFAVLGAFGCLVAAGLLVLGPQRERLVELAFDPDSLELVAGGLLLVLAGWAAVVVTTHRQVRPLDATTAERVSGALFVGALCFGVAVPFMVSARYAMVQRDFINTVFISSHSSFSATRPEKVTHEDPWGGAHRVNVLLLGGDGYVRGAGIRTDTVMLGSIDTDSGETTLFSLPRNLEELPFPKGTQLHRLYPQGFTGPGDPLEWMLNAVYQRVPEQHPDVVGKTDNVGADVLKLGVGAALGVRVDYYVLINLEGFRRLVDAIGGITVNVNEPVAIGGNTDLGVPPASYLQPGRNRHLNGFQALWFARGRYGSDDYERMDRQRCVIDAIIAEADPSTLLTRYEQIVATGKQIVRTDIPRELLPAFVRLAMDVKDAGVRSVVFRRSGHFYPEDPDFGWMRGVVDRALAASAPDRSGHNASPVGGPSVPPENGGGTGSGPNTGEGPPGGGPGTSPGPSLLENPRASCGYHPAGE